MQCSCGKKLEPGKSFVNGRCRECAGGKAAKAPAAAPALNWSDPRGRMNKTEAAWSRELEAMRLAGVIKCWKFTAVTFRLAQDTRYTPDFLVANPDGSIMFYEVKGFWREDARIKIKLAAELFAPLFKFVAVSRRKGRWEFEEF